MPEWIVPAPGQIVSNFGPRVAPMPGASTFHSGADIKCGVGTLVVAQRAGRVIFAGLNSGYGACIIVQHDDGHTTRYAHLSYIAVRVGQQVAQKQSLGASGGARGAWGAGTSTGPHLHAEHRINGVAVNPVPYWAGAAGEDFTIIPIEEEEAMPKVLFAKESNGAELWALVAPFGSRYFKLPDDIFTLQSNQAAYGTKTVTPDQLRTLVTEQVRYDANLLQSVKNTVPTITMDAAALAATLAPLLKTGATVADIEAALADDFAAIPGNVRAAIIKD